MILVVYIPCSSDVEARKIVKVLLEQRLIACANIFPVNSMYWWKGEIQDDSEVVIIAKTIKIKFSKLEEKVKELHSYDVPCIVAWSTSYESKDYAQWLSNELIEPRIG